VRHGELSNVRLPRAYVVFEDLVGLLPDAKSKIAFNLAAKRKKWEQAAAYYQLNIKTSQGMRDLYFNRNFQVDVITFIDPAFVIPMRDKLDERNLLFGGVHYYDKVDLLGDLTYDPSILAVLDPDPSRVLTWGSKGRYCSSAQLNLLNLIV
jgi:hypothetical protein